jgi:hypothetical protein
MPFRFMTTLESVPSRIGSQLKLRSDVAPKGAPSISNTKCTFLFGLMYEGMPAEQLRLEDHDHIQQNLLGHPSPIQVCAGSWNNT